MNKDTRTGISQYVNVLSSGSHGNAVLYHNSILVDIGVSFKLLEPYKDNIQMILLTHEHTDHINYHTLDRLTYERPTLRIGCSEYMGIMLMKNKIEARNIDLFETGEIYDYGAFKISPFDLEHNAPNVGYRIFKGDHKIFHATDCAHLNGIEAKGYDLYCIEHNYDEELAGQNIIRKEIRGEFAHEKLSYNNHLSEQQAKQFIFNNKSEDSKVVRLHESRL